MKPLGATFVNRIEEKKYVYYQTGYGEFVKKEEGKVGV